VVLEYYHTAHRLLYLGINGEPIYADRFREFNADVYRQSEILPRPPTSLLKCQLLVSCYGEVFDEELAAEAHAIMDTWQGRELPPEEVEVIDDL
jgi:hypothetical protein